MKILKILLFFYIIILFYYILAKIPIINKTILALMPKIKKKLKKIEIKYLHSYTQIFI